MMRLQGIPAAHGLAIGKAAHFATFEWPHAAKQGGDPKMERERLQAALENANAQLQALVEKVAAQVGASEAQVFEAQRMFLSDPALLAKAEEELNSGFDAASAWFAACEHFAQQLDRLGDETLRARAADVRDVAQRVASILHGLDGMREYAAESILIARDLTPSQTACLDTTKILAFCTAEGGATSHTAILAKALGLPAVVGLGEAILSVGEGAPLLVDGEQGVVIVSPDETTRDHFYRRWKDIQEIKRLAMAHAGEPAITRDGKRIHILANIGNLEEVPIALEYGAEGVGLLRTEFLFLGRDSPPDEETQFLAYRSVLEQFRGAPIIVRTLDVGGDKEIPYLRLPKEANPYLGYRAIRISLNEREAFKTQLRAVLRASWLGKLRVMFPMIATLEEICEAKALLEEARQELRAKNQAFNAYMPVGMMVEVPAAALMAERFADEVDFFSIGTNDLTQYVFAAERGNPRLAQLNDPCHPAVLRLIEQVVDAARLRGIWVGVCGEMAGDSEAIPLLLGLGVDELSMSPSLIPLAKETVRRWRLEQAQALARQAVHMKSAAEVRQAVRAAGL